MSVDPFIGDIPDPLGISDADVDQVDSIQCELDNLQFANDDVLQAVRELDYKVSTLIGHILTLQEQVSKITTVELVDNQKMYKQKPLIGTSADPDWGKQGQATADDWQDALGYTIQPGKLVTRYTKSDGSHES
jgi:hypothetical protein